MKANFAKPIIETIHKVGIGIDIVSIGNGDKLLLVGTKEIKFVLQESAKKEKE